MNYKRFFGKFLMLIGAICFVGATAWWYLFFEELLGQSVKEASSCFYQTTASCEVGNVIGAFGDVPAYSPVALWVAVGLFVAGFLFYAFSDHQPDDSYTTDE